MSKCVLHNYDIYDDSNLSYFSEITLKTFLTCSECWRLIDIHEKAVADCSTTAATASDLRVPRYIPPRVSACLAYYEVMLTVMLIYYRLRACENPKSGDNTLLHTNRQI